MNICKCDECIGSVLFEQPPCLDAGRCHPSAGAEFGTDWIVCPNCGQPATLSRVFRIKCRLTAIVFSCGSSYVIGRSSAGAQIVIAEDFLSDQCSTIREALYSSDDVI